MLVGELELMVFRSATEAIVELPFIDYEIVSLQDESSRQYQCKISCICICSTITMRELLSRMKLSMSSKFSIQIDGSEDILSSKHGV